MNHAHPQYHEDIRYPIIHQSRDPQKIPFSRPVHYYCGQMRFLHIIPKRTPKSHFTSFLRFKKSRTFSGPKTSITISHAFGLFFKGGIQMIDSAPLRSSPTFLGRWHLQLVWHDVGRRSAPRYCVPSPCGREMRYLRFGCEAVGYMAHGWMKL